MNKRKQKFYDTYKFVIRVIQSCITTEQLQAASKLGWLFINHNCNTWDVFVWSHLRLIAIELDAKKLSLK